MLWRIVRGALIVVAVLILIGVGIGIAARWHDGPIGPFPGGAFTTGDAAGPGVGDFGPVAKENSLELEVSPDHPRSVTTWFVVVGGTLYVPAAAAESKTWPGMVAADGRVRVRVGGKIYDLTATRVTDPEIGKLISEAITEKYGYGDGTPVEGAWAFEMVPRH
jgi:hypothetical protein